MIEGAWLYPLQGIVWQIELIQIRRVVEETRVKVTDTAWIQIEIQQRTAIQEGFLNLIQGIVLEFQCN